MKKSLKIIAATAVISMLSGCAMTTAPQSSTYWVKDDGSTYQTHKDRIATHDQRMACDNEVKGHQYSKSYTQEQYKNHFNSCMTKNHYKEVRNWYDIKPTKNTK